MVVIIKVDCLEGEESSYMSEITQEDMYSLGIILEAIRENSGYLPTGLYQVPGDPSPSELYGSYGGYKDLLGRLPSPLHGIKRISEVILADPVSTLYM